MASEPITGCLWDFNNVHKWAKTFRADKGSLKSILVFRINCSDLVRLNTTPEEFGLTDPFAILMYNWQIELLKVHYEKGPEAKSQDILKNHDDLLFRRAEEMVLEEGLLPDKLIGAKRKSGVKRRKSAYRLMLEKRDAREKRGLLDENVRCNIFF
jgi:hypothetical protein